MSKKLDVYDELYFKQKGRKESYFYSQLLCEIIKLRYELGYKEVGKKDVLQELPNLRNFKVDEINTIFKNAIDLLRIKHQLIVLEDNPFSIKKLEESI